MTNNKQYPELPTLPHPEHTMTWMESELRAIHRYARDYVDATCAMRAAQSPDHGPMAATIEEAARDVGKWLNERPNRPLDLRHVAMLVHHAQAAQPENAAVAGPSEYHAKGEIQRFNLDCNIDGVDQFREFVLASDHDALVHDLAARCDPAGLVQENGLLRDQTRQLNAMIGRLKRQTLAAPTTQAPQPVEPAVSQGEAELPDSIRVPLDSLHADAEYLVYRADQGHLTKARIVGTIRERVDAAKAGIRTALATRPQEAAPSQDAEDAARFRSFAAAVLAQEDSYLDAIESGDFDEPKTIDDVRALFDRAARTQEKNNG